MDIDQANLKNLTGLWRKYGAEEITLSNQSTGTTISANKQWPHRVWQSTAISNTDLSDSSNLLSWLDQIPDAYIDQATVPVWPFESQNTSSASEPNAAGLEQQLALKGWQCTFEQTAMYLPIQGIDEQHISKSSDINIVRVSTSSQLSAWVNIASEAFGYTIDQTVFERLLHDTDIQILLGMLDHQPVATALLYQGGSVIGLHQMGVAKGFQGKGIAKNMMYGLITQCAQLQEEYLVLQASQAGKPLYESLGFKAQFGIKNYRKN
jgi:GNAT superfamily N-acetyltransferase